MEDADASQQSDNSDAGPDSVSESDTDTDTEFPHALGFALSAILLVVAFVGATTAGVLDSVGPYLFGVSVLVGFLFLLGR